MNTNENNKLILEFMQKGSEGFGIYEFKGCFYNLNELKFHCSWDWLMTVIEKINILVMEDNSDKLYNSEEWDNITHTLIQIKIKYVYQAVVKFIKEYNQNN